MANEYDEIQGKTKAEVSREVKKRTTKRRKTAKAKVRKK